MKKIDFCAGHRLMNHGGKCENLHGHNYRLEVYVSANELDGLGRVVDFADLREHFKSWIDENWDHGFVLAESDSEAIAAIRSVTPHRLFLLPFNPTAENMARYLMDEVAPKLNFTGKRQVQVTRIVLWETETSYAEVSRPMGSDNRGSISQNAFEGESARG